MTTRSLRIVPLLLLVSLSALAADTAATRVDSIAKILRQQLHGTTSRAADSSPALAKAASASRAPSTEQVIRRPGTGTPLQLRDHQQDAFRVSSAASGPDRDLAVARNFLRRYAGLLHLADPDQELDLDRQERDASGWRHLRFAQKYRGTPVWPSELTVHLDPAGNVDLLDGSFVSTPRRVPPRPVIDQPEAMERAARSVNTDRTACGIPQLIIYSAHERHPRLAWRIGVSPSLLQSWWIIIDASNGNVLDRINRVMSQAVNGSGVDLLGVTRQLRLFQSGGSIFMIDTSKQMYDPSSQPPDLKKTRGAIVILDARNQPATSNPQSLPDLFFVTSSSATSWSIPATVSAAHWLGATYDYYLSRFNRNSIDGLGGTIMGVTRLGNRFQNAFWLDQQSLMVFGDAEPYAAGVDVVAHEMTHGVTSKTSNLLYKDQSGALNEALSDIFGEMIEAAQGRNDWMIGSSLSAPIRDMINPARFNQPTKMSDFVKTTQDDGGVHINSGIINRAFYLLTEGLNGGIGRDDATAIFYRAQTVHLTKDSQFLDARLAAISSANELFGAGSRQSTMTAAAFDAVEVFAASAPAPEPQNPVVNGSDSTLFVFFDSSKNATFLGRRETASDGNGGVTLSRFDVSGQRPSVTGDGSLAVFVDSVRDVCLIPTNGSEEENCLNLPDIGIRVSSVGMSRDARRFGFVLLGNDGTPENEIAVVDLQTNQTTSYPLVAFALDGGSLSTILFADAMSFTADGRAIVFDAFNVITLSDGSRVGAWSIGALDLATGRTESIVPPDPRYDIDSPDLGRTSDDLLTFEILDSVTGDATVVAANLDTGDVRGVGQTRGVLTVPSYTGDDRGIVYAIASNTPTGTSLNMQRLDSDRITPVGSPSTWLSDAGNATIYRRGTFSGPSTNPGRLGFASAGYSANAGATATITVNRMGGNQGTVNVSYRTVDGSAVAGRDYVATSGTLTWSDGDDDPKTFLVRMLPQATSGSLTLALSNASGGAQLEAANATLNIAGTPSTSPKPARRRATRH